MATYIYQYTNASASGGGYGCGVMGIDGTAFRFFKTDTEGALYVIPSGTFTISAGNLTAYVSGQVSATLVSGTQYLGQVSAYVSGGSALYVTASGNVSANQAGSWNITGIGYVSGGSGIYVTASGAVLATAAQSGIWNITAATCNQGTSPWIVSGNVSATQVGSPWSVSIKNALVTAGYDYMALVTAGTTDTWTYKTGGGGGSTVGTVTITFETSAKAIITTVVKT